ncbi:UMP kinase [Patescibacteria group bacterium]|nr:UMP kinase [Patescibacteria group bacterium]MBU1931366.1 UMP kinase [Patescibacteria group bacterium]
MSKLQQTFVLSLGGSVFAPESIRGIDIIYLKKFEKFLRKKISAGKRFFIVTGGGYAARDYRDAAVAVMNGRAGKLTQGDLDWLGIHASRLNAHLLRTIFQDIAYKRILTDFNNIDKQAAQYPLVIGAGWKPGCSTDYEAVLIAVDYGFNQVINLSDINQVYDKDPNKCKTTKPIKQIKWADFFKIVGDKWSPGLNVPFDPVASRLAAEKGIKVIICHGKDFKNLDNILEGKKFIGTVIE